jgi:hypothetical protein
MSFEFYILRDGQKQGPLSEEEMLDSIDLGDIKRNDWCIEAASGQKRRVGEVFQTVGTVALPKKGTPEPTPRRDIDEPSKKSEPPTPDPDISPRSERRLVYIGHPTVFTYWKSLLVAAAMALGGYYGSTYSGYLGVIGWFWASLTVVYVLVDRSTRDYIVTSVRVEIVKGLFSKSSTEVRIDDIRAINVRTKGLLGLIGIGTVEFASAGTDVVEVAFKDVWRAHKVKVIVRRIQDQRE